MDQDREPQGYRETEFVADRQLEPLIHSENVVGDLRGEDVAEIVRRGDGGIGAGPRDGGAQLGADHPRAYGAVSSRSRAAGTFASAGTDPLTQMR